MPTTTVKGASGLALDEDFVNSTNIDFGFLMGPLKETKEMSKKLDLIKSENQHQVNVKDAEIKELKQKLADANLNIKRNIIEASNAENMKAELDVCREAVKKLETCRTSLQDELQKQMEIAQHALTNVKEDRELIQKYLSQITTNKEEAENYQKRYRLTTKECNALSDKLDSTERQLRAKEQQLKKQESAWHDEEEKLKEKIHSKTNQLVAVQEAKLSLEESNHQFTLTNQKLSHSLEEAEAIINVPRSDVSVQAGPCLYLMISLGVQVCPEKRTAMVQFRPVTYTSYTQTRLFPIMTSSLTQTENKSHYTKSSVAIQTVRKVLVSKGCGHDGMAKYMEHKYSQTIIGSATFLKWGGPLSGGVNTNTVGNRGYPLSVSNFTRRLCLEPGDGSKEDCHTSSDLRKSAIVKSYSDDIVGMKTTTTNETGETRKSDIHPTGIIAGSNDVSKSMTAQLTDKIKGVLKGINMD